jgi:hypothetical protein
MKFGRVEGFVHMSNESGTVQLRLIVTLETGSRVETVRDEYIDPPVEINTAELNWLADQYTQETIGDLLSEQGWEAIGAGDIPEPEPNAPARSATYAVRNLS